MSGVTTDARRHASPSSPAAARRPRAARRWPSPRRSSRAGHAATTIHYVGARRGVETTTAAADRRTRTTLLDVVGLQRSAVAPQPAVRSQAGRAPRGRPTRCSAGCDPTVVVNVGGYASLPGDVRRHGCGASRSSSSATTVRPGLVSRLVARLAAACAVAFDGSPLPRAEVTGAPVRQAILAVDRAPRPGRGARRARPPRRPVRRRRVGGSLGSRRAQRRGRRALVERLADRRRPRRPPRRRRAASSTGAAPARDGADGHPVPRGRLRGPHGRGLRRGRPDGDPGRRQHVAELAAAGVPGDPRARGRAPPRTTRSTTPRRSATPARRCSSTEPDLDRRPPGRRDRAAARRPRRAGRHGRRRALRRRRVHRSAALVELIDERPRSSEASMIARRRRSTSSQPQRAPRRRRRRPGHERHRHRPGRDGPPGRRAATSASSRCSSGCAPPASTCTSATTASTSHGVDAVTGSTAIPAAQHRARRGRADRASRCCAGPGMLAVDLRAWPARSPWPAPTARRPRRRC